MNNNEKNGSKPTHYDSQYHSLSLLDCFITSNPKMILNYDQYWLPTISHHSIIMISLKKSKPKSETKFSYRDYKAIDIDNLKQKIESSDLHNIYEINNANDQVTFLSTFLNDLFKLFVPMKTVKFKNKNPPWYNQEIKRLSLLRDYSLNIYLKCKNDANWKTYTRIRNKVNLLIRDEKIEYSGQYFDTGQTNKILWQKIRQCETHDDGRFNAQTHQTKEEFCRYFASVQSCRPVDRIDHDIPEIPNAFNFQNFTSENLLKAISSLSSNSPGIDNIDLKFLKIVFHGK